MNYSLRQEMQDITSEVAQREYPVVWTTAKAMLPALSDEQLAIVVVISTQICSECHERVIPCNCWDDE